MQLPFIKRAGTDPDALAYFARAGIASGTQTPSSYDNAASFTSASSQFLTSTAANLQCQSQSFTVAGWFFMPSNAPAYSALITQGAHPINAGGGFTLQRFDNFNAVYLTIRNDNASTSVAVTSPMFVPSTWNFVECGWDSALNQSFISINGGTRTFSTAVAGWTFPNTTNITRLGRDPFGSFLTGNLAGWGLWKRALSASEVTQLWNNGAGRTYASLDSGLRNNLVSWWALNQNSVTADSHGTNTLTNNGTVTAPNIGPIITGYSDSRRLISDFVKGIKSLGLWNSMVCWPMRASQNANGTTAFSLGGLGQFNGTLSSSGALPTWQSGGVFTNGTTGQNINIGPTGLNAVFGTAPVNRWDMFSVTASGISSMGFFQGASVGFELSFIYNAAGGNVGLYGPWENNGWVQSGFVPLGSGGPAFVQMSRTSSTNVRYVQNGTTKDSATDNVASSVPIANASTLLANGRGSAGDAYIGVTAMQGFIIGTNADQVAIYNLYRQTLGLGLGLP